MRKIQTHETTSDHRREDGACRFELDSIRRMPSSAMGNPRFAFRVRYARPGERPAWRWIRTTVNNGACYGLSEWESYEETPAREITCTFDGRGAVESWEIHGI